MILLCQKYPKKVLKMIVKTQGVVKIVNPIIDEGGNYKTIGVLIGVERKGVLEYLRIMIGAEVTLEVEESEEISDYYMDKIKRC